MRHRPAILHPSAFWRLSLAACILLPAAIHTAGLRAGDDGGNVKIMQKSLAPNDLTGGGEGFTVTAPGYTASLSAQGQILSLKLGGLQQDLLDGGIRIGEGGKHEKPDLVKQLDAQTIQLTFPSRPVATLRFDDQSFKITIKNLKKTWDFGLYYTLSPRAQTISCQGRGFEHLALPLLKGRTAYDDAAYTFDDGCVLRVSQSGPGNHINSDENGSCSAYTWGRRCLEVNGTYNYVFTFEKGAPGAKRLSAPPFVLRQTRTGNIYVSGEPVALNLELRPEYCQKLVGISEDLVIACRTRDLWGQTVDEQEFPVDFSRIKAEIPASAGRKAKPVLFPVQLQLKKNGWLETTVTLKDKAGKVFPTSEVAAISIVAPSSGLLNPPLPEKAGTYEFNAFLGLTCHREGINLDRVFPLSLNSDAPAQPGEATKDLGLEEKKAQKQPQPSPQGGEGRVRGDVAAKWDELDKQMALSAAAQKQYGCTVFWLMESPPKWLLKDPPRFERALGQLISRYKDKNKYWMLINEPNLNMPPQDYVNNFLLPLYRAAKKADPEAKVLGPDTCGLKPDWLEKVYAAGGKMDIVDMHPYTGHHRSWEEHGMADAWRKVREVMAAHGDGQKEYWSTESGFDWSLGRLGKNNHAKHTVRQYPLAASVGIPKNHFFLYYTSFVGYHKMYLVDQDQSLLPAGVAARVESEQLSGAEFSGREEIGKDKHCYLYRGKDCDVRVAWSNDLKTIFAAAIASQKIAVFDMMGNQLVGYPQSAPAKEYVVFQLSGYPIYIRLDKGATFAPVKEDLGPNLARQEGVKVAASSEDKPGMARKVLDGVWNSENTGSYEDRLWVSAKSLKEPGAEAWLEITLPQKQNVCRVHVYAPSSICGMPGLRAFKVQAFDYGKQDWRTVGEVADSEEAWVFHFVFPAIATDRVKIAITDLNNGFKLNDKTPYTDMKPRLSEVEIYEAKSK